MQQLGIDGIGQQLATLEDWKKQNEIYANKSYVHEPTKWFAWGGTENPNTCLNEQGPDAFAFGTTEKEAVLNYCNRFNIEPPFWW